MIEGCINFRTVEGMAGHGGLTLRPGRIFRSGAYDHLTPRGLEQVRALAPRLAYDLRSRAERQHHGSGLAALDGLDLRPEPHDIALGNPLRALHQAGTGPEQGRAAMIAMYRALPFDFAPVLRDFLAAAARLDGPLIVHCQIGKDRTGAAVALLLSALGVDRDAIAEDYARTNAAVPQIRALLRARRGQGSYEDLDDPVLDTIVAADPAYLAALFDAVAAAEGSVDSYLASRLGVDAAARRALAANFLA